MEKIPEGVFVIGYYHDIIKGPHYQTLDDAARSIAKQPVKFTGRGNSLVVLQVKEVYEPCQQPGYWMKE